jgi:hypothetical protein
MMPPESLPDCSGVPLPHHRHEEERFMVMFQFLTRHFVRALPLVVFFSLAASQALQAQPVLTRIQDVVYLADGKRFNGLAIIDWRSFSTNNGAIIGQNSKVVRITDGILQAQLAPTTNSNTTYYSVKFSSGGRVLFSEIWAVPPSSSVLKLADIRAVLLPGGFVSAPTAGGGNSGGGLIGENGTGAFVDLETPVGLINGSNLVFTLAASPEPGNSLELFRNGLRLSPSVDYTISSNTITFVTGAQPQIGDVLRATYRTGVFGTAPHNLLSSLHSDTVPETVQRGDLISGQGSTPRWMRLPLGQTNRCLVSNGQDAVWNTCLFTGFSAGSVPFINTSGLLAEDLASFFWDATNRRLGLGTTLPSANLTLRAGTGQGSTDLTRWLASNGSTILASVGSTGTILASRFVAASTSTTAAYNDPGSATSSDPSNPVTGDFWYNRPQRARKTFEANQIHSLPMVLCSVGGGSTSSTTNVQIGSCGIPAEFFDSGDRIEISLNFEHSGSASGFTVEVFIGSTSVFNRSFANTDSLAFVKASGGYFPTGASFGTYSFGTAGSVPGSAFSGLSGNVTITPTAAATISFRARLNSASSDTVFLRNYTVVRYPAQFNP